MLCIQTLKVIYIRAIVGTTTSGSSQYRPERLRDRTAAGRIEVRDSTPPEWRRVGAVRVARCWPTAGGAVSRWCAHERLASVADRGSGAASVGARDVHRAVVLDPRMGRNGEWGEPVVEGAPWAARQVLAG